MPLDHPRIVCLDLDTFFVSVERLRDPSLVGRPVIVGGRPNSRGVVTACSYEVRALGVRSGMSLTKAARLAPGAVFLPVRHGAYHPYSARVRELAEAVCPVVQVASIDELYMDLQGCELVHRRPTDADDDATVLRVVNELRAGIREELGLPASAGVATSRSMAKVACGLAKPDGTRWVARGTEREVLAPLSVRKLPGIGPVAEAKLARRGLTTVGHLAEAPPARLASIFGAWAEGVRLRARGEGPGDLGRDRPAFSEHDPDGEVIGSISNERTFMADVLDSEVLHAMLSSLCERVCWRARKRGVEARTVTLKLRYRDFRTLNRSRTMAPSHSEHEVFPVVRDLFERARDPGLSVRLLGVALSNLTLNPQLSLFGEDQRLCRAVDAVRDKFGYEAVGRAQSRPTKTRRARGRPSPSRGSTRD